MSALALQTRADTAGGWSSYEEPNPPLWSTNLSLPDVGIPGIAARDRYRGVWGTQSHELHTRAEFRFGSGGRSGVDGGEYHVFIYAPPARDANPAARYTVFDGAGQKRAERVVDQRSASAGVRIGGEDYLLRGWAYVGRAPLTNTSKAVIFGLHGPARSRTYAEAAMALRFVPNQDFDIVFTPEACDGIIECIEGRGSDCQAKWDAQAGLRDCGANGGGMGCFTQYCGRQPAVSVAEESCWANEGGLSCF